MIVVELSGGLGNQMFQYAFGRRLAEQHRTTLMLDRAYLLDRSPRKNFVFRNYDLSIFNIQEQIAPKEISSYFGYMRPTWRKAIQSFWPPRSLEIIKEQKEHYRHVVQFPDSSYLKGYWHNVLYFDPIAPIIREEFSFKEKLSENCKELMANIQESESVCLNVRRADFVDNPTLGTLDPEFYRRAAIAMQEHVQNPTYFVFSDDIEWCETNLKIDGQIHFVQHAFAGDKFRNYLELMMNCKKFIIPNSSFAWWAAWLSTSVNKTVIAPEIWRHSDKTKISDFSPKDWITLD